MKNIFQKQENCNISEFQFHASKNIKKTGFTQFSFYFRSNLHFINFLVVIYVNF